MSEELNEDGRRAIAELLAQAVELERRAADFRLQASKIAHPPPGVDVYIGWRGSQLTIQFVGPTLVAA